MSSDPLLMPLFNNNGRWADDQTCIDRLCVLSVIRQVHNTASTTIVQNAWHRGQELAIHGWVYSLADGLLKDLGCTIAISDGIEPEFRIEHH